ncbi:MAG TPA: ATP-binding protein [Methylomirabilota bacterium]|nr:ATP-binding protein [Methylomirabilota bacterium]
MKTLLVLAPNPGLAAAVRTVLDPERFRVVHQLELWEAEALLGQGTIDAIILDADLTNIQPIRVIEKIRRRLPSIPVLVFSSTKQWEWEEEAYLLGVAHVLNKPVRGRLMSVVLERFWTTPARPASTPAVVRPSAEPRAAEPARSAPRALEVLRNFSGVLTHSLHAEALLKRFLMLLREIIGVNRAAIFLRPPPGSLGDTQNTQEARRLRSACAIGIPPGLLEHFELSLEAGIGGHLFRLGRILRNGGEETHNHPEIQKEFELLGAQVAIPILDRESFVGVAVFDGRVTGDPLGNEELALIFHMLEELGLAIKNIWLHDQMAANNLMMVDILRQITSGCVVVGRDLSILHSNEMARQFFAPPERRDTYLEFSDLPQLLGSRVYEVLKTGQTHPPFRYRPASPPETIYLVTVSSFQKQNSAIPNAALVLVEDVTRIDRVHRLELEAANLRLVRTMAERLAHEVGNSLVPLATHQQLLAKKYSDPEFRASLEHSMAESVRRISRLSSQMLFLTRDSIIRRDSISLPQLIEEAFREAQGHQTEKAAKLHFESTSPPMVVSGDRAGLKQALSEVMLNALQANPGTPQVAINARSQEDETGQPWVRLEISDTGAGFSSEALGEALKPFYTTRNVGLGLGLTVTQKIIETHHGNLQIIPTSKDRQGSVVISLPLTGNGSAADKG